MPIPRSMRSDGHGNRPRFPLVACLFAQVTISRAEALLQERIARDTASRSAAEDASIEPIHFTRLLKYLGA
jgi:hypothetical protein